MKEKRTEKKRGRPSVWSDELGNGVNNNERFPVPIWNLLREKETKKLLNKMALNENIKLKAWELGQ